MQFFYDGQIRRYVTQLMRLMSNFPVKYGDGTIKTVPVMYGDLSRQVAHLIKDNSENKLPSAPRMSVYITGLEQDRDRTQDATFIDKLNLKEREYDTDTGSYLNTQGKNYTVERLMPAPYTRGCFLFGAETARKCRGAGSCAGSIGPDCPIGSLWRRPPERGCNALFWRSWAVQNQMGTTYRVCDLYGVFRRAE